MCIFLLNEQTICPILTGIHKVYILYLMHINILYKISLFIIDGLCFI